ncbi:MAG: HEAT repeat domain-containing protein [Chloroflexota bacterium]
MADPSPKYEKYVEGYTRYLRSKDVGKRRKGARMVGELGADGAIETLLDLAKNDPDPQVRRNATYSLGMFVAFRDAMESDDDDLRDEAEDALIRVVETGQIGKIGGKQKGGAPGWLVPVLSVLLVVLIAGNAVVFLGLVPGMEPDGGGSNEPPAVAGDGEEVELSGVVAPDAEDRDVEVLITQGRDAITVLTGNAQTLRTQLEPLAAGNPPDQDLCSQFYDLALTDLSISAGDAQTYPRVVSVYEDVNASRESFNTLHSAIQSICFDGAELDTVDAGAELAALDTFDSDAPMWSATLGEARELPVEAEPPTEVPAATDVPLAENATEEPTVAPTEPPNIRRHIANAVEILDDAGNNNDGSRSTYNLLEQYLIEASENNGVTDGCRNTNLPVPANYNLEAEARGQYDLVIAEEPGLQPAIDQINTGLDLLRVEIDSFSQACRGGEGAVASYAGRGLGALQQIRVVFDNADEQVSLLLAN